MVTTSTTGCLQDEICLPPGDGNNKHDSFLRDEICLPPGDGNNKHHKLFAGRDISSSGHRKQQTPHSNFFFFFFCRTRSVFLRTTETTNTTGGLQDEICLPPDDASNKDHRLVCRTRYFFLRTTQATKTTSLFAGRDLSSSGRQKQQTPQFCFAGLICLGLLRDLFMDSKAAVAMWRQMKLLSRGGPSLEHQHSNGDCTLWHWKPETSPPSADAGENGSNDVMGGRGRKRTHWAYRRNAADV